MGKKQQTPPPKKTAEEILKEFDPDLAASMPGMSDEKLNDVIATAAKQDVELREAKKNDTDLKDKKEAAKEANEVYSGGAKRNRSTIEYAREILVGRGKA